MTDVDNNAIDWRTWIRCRLLSGGYRQQVYMDLLF